MENISEVYNCDCLDYMKTIPDGFFDLALVDPPYGSVDNEEWDKNTRGRFGGIFNKYKIERTGGTWSKKYQEENNIKHWDIAPSEEYFDELFRISKNQIIWGGNYFGLPPNRCFIIWKKLTISESFSMAMCEYAWCSFNENAKLYECAPQDKNRFHPTQKPISLYEWILRHYAKEGDKVFDSHMGSQSSRIACWNAKLDYYGCELDESYFRQGCERFNEHIKQLTLF